METTMAPQTVQGKKHRTSPLWKVFKRLSPGVAKCCICKRVLSFKSSNTNLRRHLLSRHHGVFESLTGQNDSKVSKSSEMNASIKKLIELVQEHPCLWDTRCDPYGNAQKQHEAWNLIASQVCPNDKQSEVVSRLSEQFHALRNGYFSNPWSGYSRELSFMAPLLEESNEEISSDKHMSYASTLNNDNELCMRTRPQRKSKVGKENGNELEANSDVDERQNQNKQQVPEVGGDLHMHKKNPTANQTVCNIEVINADEDNLFLLSLVNEMKKVPEALDVDFKAELLAEFGKLLKRYLDDVE